MRCCMSDELRHWAAHNGAELLEERNGYIIVNATKTSIYTLSTIMKATFSHSSYAEAWAMNNQLYNCIEVLKRHRERKIRRNK